METLDRILRWLYRWQYSGLCLLLFVVLVLHFTTIMQPNEPLFDEIHYVEDGRLIIDGDGTNRLEHPPLGKLILAGGMHLFGDNPFGWRFFSVIFGAAGIIFMYLICRRLNLSKKVSYLATFLLAIENLSFVQGGIAMLDVFSITLMLASFWLYLKERYVMSGVAVGLCALAKLSGALAIVVIGLHWFLTVGYAEIGNLLSSLYRFLSRRRSRWHFLLQFFTFIKTSWRFVLLALAAPITFIALMPLLDYVIWGEWLNPISQINRMLSDTGSIIFTPDYPEANNIATRPWEWLLPIWYGKLHWAHFVLPYWFTPIRFLGMISPSITVLAIPAVIYMIYRAIKGKADALFPFSWFLGTYMIWIPASLITNRVSYLFYFYPTVGAICIGLAIAIFKLIDLARERQGNKLRWFVAVLVPLYLLAHIYAFINIGPFSIGQTNPPYIGINITTESIWWAIPICLLLYLFTLRYLGIIKWFGFGDSLTPAETQVDTPDDSPTPAENRLDKPPEQE
ncbi:MAG: phospholipid carrier-dependent glycosyltransferase [Dehalococcoidales bacterium]|nr:phospholipid carrier-dependent glycosyltransferase [Dehalococcoidales bacterium]